MHLPSAQHYVDFVRTAGGPVMAILAPLSADAQRDAWHDIAQQLTRFNTADGWVGPNALLLCAGTRPPQAATKLGQAARTARNRHLHAPQRNASQPGALKVACTLALQPSPPTKAQAPVATQPARIAADWHRTT